MEFGLVNSKGFFHLHKCVPEIFVKGDNELPDIIRPTLSLMHNRLLNIKYDINEFTDTIEKQVNQNDGYRRLLDIRRR